MLQCCYENFSVLMFYHTHISLISYSYTQNNEFILNALLECINFNHTLYFNLAT